MSERTKWINKMWGKIQDVLPCIPLKDQELGKQYLEQIAQTPAGQKALSKYSLKDFCLNPRDRVICFKSDYRAFFREDGTLEKESTVAIENAKKIDTFYSYDAHGVLLNVITVTDEKEVTQPANIQCIERGLFRGKEGKKVIASSPLKRRSKILGLF